MTFKDEFLDAWERRTMLPDCPLKAFDEKYDVRQRIIDAARRREAEETKRRAEMTERNLEASPW